MAQIRSNIFRKYDIRGMVAGADPELTPQVAELVGKAYGSYIQRSFGMKQIFVGGDNRLSTPPLKDAIIKGLASTGVRVVDVGLVMTPTVYYAAASNANSAGIMITGSHLNTQYNGIKMAYGKLAMADAQIQDLLHMIQNDDFNVAQGEVVQDFDMIHRHMKTIQGMVKMGNRKLKV
ncbi:MAG: phosphomannomutase, partial [Anaerolineae bacterium]